MYILLTILDLSPRERTDQRRTRREGEGKKKWALTYARSEKKEDCQFNSITSLHGVPYSPHRAKKRGKEMEKEGYTWTVCAGCGGQSKTVGQDKDGEEPAAIHHDGWQPNRGCEEKKEDRVRTNSERAPEWDRERRQIGDDWQMESGWKEGYKTQPMAHTVGYEAVKGAGRREMASLMRKSRLGARGPSAVHCEMRWGEITDEKKKRARQVKWAQRVSGTVLQETGRRDRTQLEDDTAGWGRGHTPMQN